MLVTAGETAATVRFFHADGTPYGKRPDAQAIETATRAYAALRSLGFGETETKRALLQAQSHVGRAPSDEEVVRAALRVLTEPPGAFLQA